MKVCIAGAGVIGASIAYQLALRGVGATLIERHEVANAASGKSGGFLARDWCEGTPQDALARLSFDMHQDLADVLGTDYGYRRVDTYAIGASAHASSGRAALDTPSWVDGRCALQGRLGDTRSTAQLHPAAFTRALVDAACARGATLRHGCVRGVVADARDARLTGVQVDEEVIDADALVIA
ncbi:MAG: FAD-binding oxidoreductase, partial [Gammaproteobacteria bacterium]|nr:FAD-binding oxidoreductase [Gammaproteobacteria bacterium]